jgi:hypothetical protein
LFNASTERRENQSERRAATETAAARLQYWLCSSTRSGFIFFSAIVPLQLCLNGARMNGRRADAALAMAAIEFDRE